MLMVVIVIGNAGLVTSWRVKTLAEWMKTDLQKRGFEGPEIAGGHRKP